MTTKTKTLPGQRRHRDATGPPTTTPDAATTGPLPTVVVRAARENLADALRWAADLWDAEPGDRYVREDRPSTWMRELAAQLLGGPEHHHRHRTGWT